MNKARRSLDDLGADVLRILFSFCRTFLLFIIVCIILLTGILDGSRSLNHLTFDCIAKFLSVDLRAHNSRVLLGITIVYK